MKLRNTFREEGISGAKRDDEVMEVYRGDYRKCWLT